MQPMHWPSLLQRRWSLRLCAERLVWPWRHADVASDHDVAAARGRGRWPALRIGVISYHVFGQKREIVVSNDSDVRELGDSATFDALSAEGVDLLVSTFSRNRDVRTSCTHFVAGLADAKKHFATCVTRS